MNSSMPDEQTLQRLISAIEAMPPRPHHSGLLAAAAQSFAQSFSDGPFRHVLTKGGWYRMGGVLGPDGGRLGEDLETWVDAELSRHGDDFKQFVNHYVEAGVLVTRHMGRTHYFAAPYGPAPEDFLQLEVEEFQEVLDRQLIDDQCPPIDRQELVEPIAPTRVQAQPVGSSRYHSARLLDIGRVLNAQSPYGAGELPLFRFMSEWSESRAADRSYFCEHWLITGLASGDHEAGTPYSPYPMSVHSRTLRPFQWDTTSVGPALGDQIRDFDRAAGYPGAWYFHLIATRLVPQTLATLLKHDLDSGYHYLAQKDLALLEKLAADPYRLGPAAGRSN